MTPMTSPTQPSTANSLQHFATGDDSPPLMNHCPEPPPSHWGKLTSRGRTNSEAYLRFANQKPAEEQK